MGLLERLFKRKMRNEQFNIEEYNNYNARKIEEFLKRYDLSTIDGIRSIPISEAKRYSDGGKSVVYMPEQILNRKATEYKKIKEYDLAIECLKKANELYADSFYSYTREDYERLVDLMILAEKYEEAKIEHNKLNKLYGTRLQELRELQKTVDDKEEYEKRVINSYIQESNDREQYYWILQKIHQFAPKSFGAYRRMKNSGSENYKKLVIQIQSMGYDINNLKFWDYNNIVNNDTMSFEMDTNIKEYKHKKNLNLEHNITFENSNYEYPPIKLINCNNENSQITELDTKEMAIRLQNIFNSFKIPVKVQNIVIGPAIITYEIELGVGVNIAKIKRLEADLSLNLGSKIINIEQVPNRSLLGIEVERNDKKIVALGELLDTDEFKNAESKSIIALGQEMNGYNKFVDLEDASHMLISGTTGSGKSMCLHSIINSILYKANPNEVKLLMIDTKAVELSLYNGIPHLLVPVITDYKKASGILAWAIYEMENRYKLIINKGVKDFNGYNKSAGSSEKLSQIVIIIDEYADLIENDKNTIEEYIYKVTQRARKVGIYVIIATERPSTNIISGTIKANIPTRIALKTVSQADSKVIIDVTGAEKLLGNGDMLYYSIGISKPIRIQGSYINDEQIINVVQFLKGKYDTSDTHILETIEDNADTYNENQVNDEEDIDPFLDEAIDIVVETGQASTSFIQRRFRIGYARAGKIIDQLEERGVISGYQGSKPREVLWTLEKLDEIKLKK